jgi:hypothetical protein
MTVDAQILNSHMAGAPCSRSAELLTQEQRVYAP